MSDSAISDDVCNEERANELRHERWTLIALVLGFNEAAKTARTLGEKVYHRLRRDAAQEELVKVGGPAAVEQTGTTVLTISPDQVCFIRFTDADIELMRAAVAEHDALKGAGT